MVHSSYIFININSCHTAYTIAWKTGTYFGKKRDFSRGSYVNKFKGAHQYAYFLKLYITLYSSASFQLFSNIRSFRRGDFISVKKQITEILTQIRQSFCKRKSKSFIEKISQISPLERTSVMKKKQFIRDFLFSKPINLGTSVRKTNRRSRNKERPKELRRKHYCSIKVPFHQSQHL